MSFSDGKLRVASGLDMKKQHEGTTDEKPHIQTEQEAYIQFQH